MATVRINYFTAYDLTPEELTAGQSYSTVQLQVLQNLLSMAAHQRINLKYDPLNPLNFVQLDAELKGQISILSGLIEGY